MEGVPSCAADYGCASLSAGGVQQSRDSPAVRCEVVVLLDRCPGLFVYDLELAVTEDPEGLWTGLQAELASPAQDDDLRLVLEQLVDICRLDSGVMLGAGLPPVPGSAAAGPELRVAQAPEPLDLDVPPALRTDLWRALGLQGHVSNLDRIFYDTRVYAVDTSEPKARGPQQESTTLPVS